MGDISGAVAWTALHYMAPPGPSVLVGQTPAYRAPARQQTHTTFVSTSPAPLLVATPPRVVTGGRVSLWGGGFHPHARVHLVLASRANPRGWALGAVRSAADGTLHTTVTIPSWVTHAEAVRAYSSTGDVSSAAPFKVWPALPHLVPSSYSGTAGAAYSLSGDGFTPGERVALYLDSTATPPVAVTTSGDGHIAFTGLHVPIAAASAHLFVVQGARRGRRGAVYRAGVYAVPVAQHVQLAARAPGLGQRARLSPA